jgi:small-conductance mechanosensitive channel
MAESTSELTAMLNRPLVELGSISISLGGLLIFIAVIVVSFLLSMLFRRSMRRMGSRSAEANRPSYYAIGQLGHYVIIVIGLVVALQGVGINLSSLAVAAGAIGIGIGLGLQQAMNNFIAGLILLFERSIKVGDFIELENGLQGTTREINMRSTVITTNDNLDVVVPNSMLTNGVLTNWTMNEASRRIHVPFGVAYGSEKERVRDAALEAAARVASETHAAGLREPQVWLVGFGDSSLNFELVVWVGRDSVMRPGRTQAQYLWEIETSLRDFGIEIPFPQRDLHLRSGFEQLQAPKEP